jgi:hypothetical protein
LPRELFQSYVTTVGQSASLSLNKATIWGLRPNFNFCQTVAGLLMWGALSDERTGMSFARVTVSSSGTYLKEKISKNSKNKIINESSVSKFKQFSKLAHYLRFSR